MPSRRAVCYDTDFISFFPVNIIYWKCKECDLRVRYLAIKLDLLQIGIID